jgi:hypothetical protein
LNVSGVLGHSERALKLARCANKEIKGSGICIPKHYGDDHTDDDDVCDATLVGTEYPVVEG